MENFPGPQNIMLNINSLLQYCLSVGTNPRFKNPYAGAVKLLLLAAFDFEGVCILD